MHGCILSLSIHLSIIITGTGLLENEKIFLIISAAIILFSTVLFILRQLFLIYLHRRIFFKSLHNWVQVVLYPCVVVFVLPLCKTCWCYPSWKWQIGVVAVFLVWVNFLFLLRHIPHVGQKVTMLAKVYGNFLSVIYLPILLILTFSFPLYITFVGTIEVC